MAKPYYEFFCPVKVIAGHAALEHIPFELATLGAKRPLIITDKGVRANNLLAPIEAAFESTDAKIAAIFDDVPPDSSLGTVRSAAQLYRDHDCDAIIAVGGGSVIDTSKATNILVSEGGDDLLKYSGAHNLPKPLKPFFVIPTTSGTGSEVTMVAVVSDTEKNVKMPCSDSGSTYDSDPATASNCHDSHGCDDSCGRSLYLYGSQSNFRCLCHSCSEKSQCQPV